MARLARQELPALMMHDRAVSPGTPLPDQDQCHVLVVDDDSDCLEEYAEAIIALGYPCLAAGDAKNALRMILEEPRIGIVVTDIHMPAMDGLTLLDELSARVMTIRPLAVIVVTGLASIDSAIRAMRANAVDFLPKPVLTDQLAGALRSAFKRWAHRVGEFRLLALAQAGLRDKTGLQDKTGPRDKAGLGANARTSGPEAQPPSMGPAADDAKLRTFVRSIMKSRQKRSEFLDPGLFADPAWDILLDLTTAALDGKPVPVSSVCAATQVPLSTALRHVKQLVDTGLVRRWQDPTDKRRTLLELEKETLASMRGYLAAVLARNGAPGI